jgi:hypothetical protein
MSLKGVELQIAIPKTFDAGKMADQAAQLTLGNQAASAEAMNRQLERNRSTVTTSENTEEIHADEDQNHNKEFENHKEKDDNKNESQAEVKHPYKGNFVDFSG